jgi:hypothetical protein
MRALQEIGNRWIRIIGDMPHFTCKFLVFSDGSVLVLCMWIVMYESCFNNVVIFFHFALADVLSTVSFLFGIDRSEQMN